MTRILLVEDDLSFTQLIAGFLKKHGYQVDIQHNIKDGTKAIRQTRYQLAMLDYRLPDGNGLDLLSVIRKEDPKMPVIIMTAFNDIRTAVRAMRMGALDYITKPINPDELLMLVKEGLSRGEIRQEPKAAAPSLFVKGTSRISEQLNEYINLVGPTDMSVIIQGESGTGKEYVARTIHMASKRSAAPFVAIDCGAISEELASSELFGHVKGSFTGAVQDKQGQFEFANGGTLFLDEVGNLGYGVQVKLLRAIQERVIQPIGSNKQVKVDVRIITATNDDLQESVAGGSFREDLYHRLNEFKITVPALRNRGQDLDIFVKHFMDLANKELERSVQEIAPEVMAIFRSYDWPGNLRELKNVIKRAVLLSKGSCIYKSVIPDEMILSAANVPKYPDTDLKAMNEINEKELIIKTLQETKYNKSKTAALLNIDRKTLYLKIARYNIDH